MNSLNVLIEDQRRAQALLEHFLQNFDSRPAELKTRGYTQSLLAEVETTFNNFKRGHEEVYQFLRNNSILEDDVPYLKEMTFFACQDSYITLKSKLVDLQVELTTPSSPAHASTFALTTTRNDTTIATARLPKIDLPTFTGDYLQWIPYQDMFVSLVHNNASLTQVQKYFYLRSSCSGTPRDMVNEYPATDSSYDLAWKALVSRYHNKRKLVDQILKRLFNIPNTDGSLHSVQQLLDVTRNCLALLKTVDVDTANWDAILMFLLTQKLNKQIRKEWEQALNGNNEVPPINDFLKFLESTYRALEFVEEEYTHHEEVSNNNNFRKATPRRKIHANTANATHVPQDYSCACCQKNHALYKCFKFASLSAAEKKDVVRKNRLCINCFGRNHMYSECKSNSRCQICKELHHTLLHSDPVISNITSKPTHFNTSYKEDTPNGNAVKIHTLSANVKTQVLLATVQVVIETPGRKFHFKALVDQGAQASFISEDAVQLLKLKKEKANAIVSGIGNTDSFLASKSINIILRSHYDEKFNLKCQCLVLPKVTSYKSSAIDSDFIRSFSDLFLADPTFASPSDIDIILGSDVYGDLLLQGVKKSKHGLLLQETYFGWMISGPIKSNTDVQMLHANLCTIDDQLRLFWEQEELFDEPKLSPEDAAVEKHFLETHTRDKAGRYEVHLPFKRIFTNGDLPRFTGTAINAVRRLKQLETRFKSQPEFAKLYKTFMLEYENLGHMHKIGDYPNDILDNSYIFCHHGVLRESSSTTKLRVVFDGGNHGPDNTSLNAELAAGPALQNDLPRIISRWRCHKIAFTADLEKMFRQINVCEEHQRYQCILWREDPTKPIQIYKLRTVTYGTTSAPYLAIRVLHQLATDEQESFPLASKILKNDSYVDDVISGAESAEEAIGLHKQLISLTNRGRFNLRKWNTNSKELLEVISLENRDKIESFELKNENLVKALGLHWETNNDEFTFKLNFEFASNITKSSLLSDAAKLFDPLGWLAPSTIIAKTIFQQLWIEGLDWHDPLPQKLHDQWTHYRDSLKYLANIKIPRWLNWHSKAKVDLHGFSDASQAAYGAVVYAVVHVDNNSVVTLIQSKSKVAPLKAVSIPRLELCAATLLAKLVDKVKTYFEFDISSTHYWTDSKTVLSWIQSNSTRWTVYVANRVAEIQRRTNITQWKYVNTKENPADCLTRGLKPPDLISHNLWWNGPQWLTQSENFWPNYNRITETTLEQRKTTVNLNAALISNELEYPSFIQKYSSLSRLIRVTAWILRFYFSLKTAVHNRKENNNIIYAESGFLKSSELRRALTTVIKITQAVDFHSEISSIQNKQILRKNNKIIQFTPFLDEDNLLRVGGRISKAAIICPSPNFAWWRTADDDVCTAPLLDYISPQCSETRVKELFGMFKFNAKVHQQQMGNLPAVRLQPAKPFKHSGLDYAGPILIKQSTLRKAATSKAYICLFVCMSTRALHLEAVSSLTTTAFLAAFRRFISRRGRCTDLYSDCGTTFIGANKELQVCFDKQKMSLPEHLASGLANEGTTWHFIPPASPHFGGLWEAGVKSAKHHLRRVMRDRVLTFEELCTLLAQIESCLNSRPLCPLAVQPGDSQILTPAHFLVGEPTTCISEENLCDANINHLSRWKLVERLKQHFWQRWSTEYIHSLQNRSKWSQPHRNVAIGDVVLLQHERSSPGYWPLARIEKTHAGTDGLVRVVTLNCNGKLLKRPITKICLLPTEVSEDPGEQAEDLQLQ